jgi:carboxyl-terminal processing protease
MQINKLSLFQVVRYIVQIMKRLTKCLLVAALEIVLLAPMLLSTKIDRGNKSIDDYWAETDLSSTELDALLDNKICYADRLSYLACVNSVSQMAERFNKVLSENGDLRPMTRADIEQRLNEKKDLTRWASRWDQGQILKHPTFLDIWHTIESQYVTRTQHTSVVANGLNGYLSIAKDPHSYVIPLDFYEEMIARSDSKQTNLGFIARRNKDYAVIRKVFEKSPAEKAGLHKGDHILRINGIDVGAMLPNQFSDLIKLKDGDRLSVLIERWKESKRSEKYFEIVKSDYVTPNVTSQMIEGSRRLGLLTINKFAKDTCSETLTHLTELVESGSSGIMMDLRDNPGGQVEEAACILNLFLDKGTRLFETRYMDPVRPVDKYVAEKKPHYKGPLVVLINSGSASASEIVAGVLKDVGRATLIGERSFGKGTFQDGRLWGSHAKIAVFETEGMYYFPSGWTPQLVGIEPDISVEFSDSSAHREEELFYNPIVPRDIWTGPQTLTWIQLMQCQDSAMLWRDLGERNGDDPQVVKAREWLNCQGGSLKTGGASGKVGTFN